MPITLHVPVASEKPTASAAWPTDAPAGTSEPAATQPPPQNCTFEFPGSKNEPSDPNPRALPPQNFTNDFPPRTSEPDPAPPSPFCPRFARAPIPARHLVHHPPVCLKTVAAPSTPSLPCCTRHAKVRGVISSGCRPQCPLAPSRAHAHPASAKATKRPGSSPLRRSRPGDRPFAAKPKPMHRKIARPNPGSSGRHAKLHERIMPEHARTRDGRDLRSEITRTNWTRARPNPTRARIPPTPRPARPRSARAPVSARPLLHRPPACLKNVARHAGLPPSPYGP